MKKLVYTGKTKDVYALENGNVLLKFKDNDYLSEHNPNLKTDKLKVLVGHTPLQVVCGSVLGAAVAIAYHFIF